jgi:hypothetical protein
LFASQNDGDALLAFLPFGNETYYFNEFRPKDKRKSYGLNSSAFL